MVEQIEVPNTDGGPTLEQEAAAQEAAAKAAGEAGKAAPLNGEQENSADGERPEWLPEKFKTVEDMAKAYAELEKAQGAPKEETQEAAEKAVENAGLDMTKLSAEYNDKGELSEESYKALEGAGIPKDVVDQYISGLEAQSETLRQELLAPAGGEEGYNKMLEWAGENLNDAEIDAYNKALESGDKDIIKMAVEGLNTKFKANATMEPSDALDGKPGANTANAYESTADLLKDMNNPEYATNPAFRAKVEAKLARSNIM